MTEKVENNGDRHSTLGRVELSLEFMDKNATTLEKKWEKYIENGWKKLVM